jgi:hypothetical protein
MRILTASTLLLAALASSSTAQAQWLDADVNGPTPAGSTVNNGATLTVSGGGGDIWGNSDQFHYYYTNVAGQDWSAVMRVQSFTGPDYWSKAGLMVRQSTGAPAGADAHITAITTRTGGRNGVLVGYRPTSGAGSGDADSGVAPPYPNCWLRIVRQGAVFRLYRGSDGVNWTLYNTFDTATTDRSFSGTPWPDPILVGVAVTSHSQGNAMLGAATVSDLTVSPLVPPTTITVTEQVTNAAPAYVGSEASFRFAVSGNGVPQDIYQPSYQWYKNNQLMTNATGANYTFLARETDSAALVYCQASFPAFPGVVPVNSATGLVTVLPGALLYTNGLKVERFSGYTREDVNGNRTGRSVPNRITSFDIPGGFGNNYAQRVSGWFIAPTAGNYTFYISSDDDADLFLSTDSDPANKRIIAQQVDWSGYRKYTSGNGISQKCSDTWTPDGGLTVPNATGIALAAGGVYYLETSMHQGGGGDNLCVTYRMFENTTEVMDDTPSKLAEANGNIVLITSPTTFLTWTTQPTNTTVFEGQTVTFRSLANSDSEFAVLYQWYRGTTPIAGATGPNYSLPTVAADSGATFFVVANTQEGGLSITSSVVALTVQQSVFEPGWVKVEFWAGGNKNLIENGTAGEPTYVTTSPAFEASVNNEAGTGYGRRLSGFFVPATTGDYDFFVNSDDASDLYISTTASVVNKYLIAQETTWSDPRKWVSSGGGSTLSQKRSDTWSTTAGGTAPYAAGIHLTGGSKYYMEINHTEGSGGDNCEANFKVHGAADPVDNTPSLLTGSLIGMNAVRCSYVAFTQQPQSATNYAMNTVTFSAPAVTDSTLSIGVTGDPRPLVANPVYVIYQWYKDNVAIPGANSSSYTTPPLLPSDNGAVFMCKVRALGYANASLQPIWSNSLPATLTVPATVWEPGYVKVDFWSNKTRDEVESGAAGTPDYSTAVAQFGVSPNAGDYYSRRFSGFFVPPATGNYVLFVNADDDADLFLNPLGLSPDGKKLVAQETTYGTGSLNWTTDNGNLNQRRSDTFTDPTSGLQPWAWPGIALTGGQKYYLEGVHHEGSGGDYFESTYTLYDDAWALANGTPMALTGGTIGMYAPRCSYVAFTQQPQSTTVVSLAPATFSVAGTSDATLSVSPNGPPTTNNFLIYQWYKNTVAIPGATAATLIIPEAMPGDNGAEFVCKIRALGLGDTIGNAIWSNSLPATLNVTTVPAAFKYAAYVPNENQGPGVAYVTLAFDKSMNVGTLMDTANYTLAGGLAKTGTILVNSNNNRQVAIEVTGSWSAAATVAATGLLDAAAQSVALPTSPVQAIPVTTSDLGTPGTDPVFPTMLWVDGARDYTIVAEGSDFWNNADGGNFTWELKTGDFDVITRVKSVTRTDNWAKGGLMARDTLDAGSRNWNIVCSPTLGANQVNANSRTALNGGTGTFSPTAPTPAYPNALVRLTRAGNVISAYYSTNGLTWTSMGSQTSTAVGDSTPLPASMYVGLCATAHSNDTVGVEPYRFWNQVDFADYNSTFVSVVPVTLSVVLVGNNAQVTRTPNAGQLYSSPVLGPGAVWTLAPAGNPAIIPVAPGQNQFFKVMP